jgi:hypothetical protein
MPAQLSRSRALKSIMQQAFDERLISDPALIGDSPRPFDILDR